MPQTEAEVMCASTAGVGGTRVGVGGGEATTAGGEGVTSTGVGLGDVTAGLATAGTTAGVGGAVGDVGAAAGAEGVGNWTLKGKVPFDVVAVMAWLHSIGCSEWFGAAAGQKDAPVCSASHSRTMAGLRDASCLDLVETTWRRLFDWRCW